MTTQQWLLAGFAPLAVALLGESIWRLWRGRPASYGSIFAEVILLVGLVAATLSNHAAGTPSVVVKIIVVTMLAAATALRLIARKRFAAQS